ncbi:MAG: hypothetical protein R2713_02665 [Ilumatobacteraceae bacterium]
MLPASLDDAYVDELRALAGAYGITRTGVAPATVMQRARRELVRRRDAGLHDGMQFTYKNPERSTDPGQAVRGARAVFVGARPYLVDLPAGPDDRTPVEPARRRRGPSVVAQVPHHLGAL